ncbi:MAG: choice-of-anchor D domain-containing protein, partial [Terriglobia bacterium]
MTNDGSGTVTVIDGATNATTTIPAGLSPHAVAVNPVTNKIYVANVSGNNVTVIDGATNATTTVTAGTSPWDAAVNPVTNQIYVTNAFGSSVTVIDGATDTSTTVAVGVQPYALAVNPVSNKIYVANGANNNVTVIDGATNSTTTVVVGTVPCAVAVNPVTNKIYVANRDSNNVTVIDGATNATSTVTNRIYVTNGVSNSVTVIEEQNVQSIPLQATITPLAGDITGSLTPTFSFGASSAFTPFAPPPDNLLFQADTWQGPWVAATNQGGGNFSGTTPTLQPGFHILYAYATDGQEATSTITRTQNSPLISNIAAYGLLVSPASAPAVSLSATSLSFGNQLVSTASAAQTVTVSNGGGAPLVITTVLLGGTNPGDFSMTENCSNATLAPSGNCTVSVTFTPSLLGPESAAITITDNDNDVAGSTQIISLTGNGTGTPAISFSATSVIFAGNPLGVNCPTKDVTVTNTGNVPLGITAITPSAPFSETN